MKQKKPKRILTITIVLFAIMASTFSTNAIYAGAKKISGVSAAKKLARTKVKGAIVTDVDVEHEDGVMIYDVELHKGKYEYNLEYRASDSKLVKYEWDLSYIGSSKTSKISKAKIRSKAKKKVKNAKILSISYDADFTKPEYDVVMKKSNKKYKLTYNAHNGKLVEYGWSLITSTKSSTKKISMEKAKSIASKKVPGGEFVKVEFDNDDGISVYEIEMIKDGLEYELKIDAKTGKIIEFEVDD